MLNDVKRYCITINMKRKNKVVLRDEQLGFRVPRDVKARIEELSRKTVRDMSDWAMEWVIAGLARAEQDTTRFPSLTR